MIVCYSQFIIRITLRPHFWSCCTLSLFESLDSESDANDSEGPCVLLLQNGLSSAGKAIARAETTSVRVIVAIIKCAVFKLLVHHVRL